MLELADDTDDQSVLAVARTPAGLTHFAPRRPTLVELFREAVATPTEVAA